MSKTKGKIDTTFVILLAAVLIIGLAVLWSASTAESIQNFGNTTGFLVKQLTRGVLIGLVGMYIVSKIDYRKYLNLALPFLAISIILLLLVKVPGVGFSANGASRWISVGPIFFQPGEFAKFALVLFLASWLSTDKRKLNQFKDWWPPLLITGMMFILILSQPDLGTSLSLAIASGIMLIAGGINWRYFLWIIGGGIAGIAGLIIAEPYRLKRITTFLHPSSDPLGIGYQINQALIAIGSGGLFGYGYGLSRQKYFYLPEAITDSIFAVMSEELGFIRVVLILALFALFILKGLKIASAAPDKFGKLLGTGLVGILAANAIINIAAILAIVPLTGVPLPFFSYGSSAMIINLLAVGVLLNISRQNRA